MACVGRMEAAPWGLSPAVLMTVTSHLGRLGFGGAGTPGHSNCRVKSASQLSCLSESFLLSWPGAVPA